MISEKHSPFEPRKPVSPEKLEGRKQILTGFIKYFDLALHGQPQHFYLYGNRGVGKSSIATYLKEYAKLKYDMVGIHVYNDGIDSLEDLINNIVDKLLNEVKDKSWAKSFVELFKEHIEEIGFLGNSIKFQPQNKNVTENIKNNFDEFLVNTLKEFDKKNGLFIIIDDINGLSKTPNFANWYKSFADSLSTNFNTKIPLIIMLTSHPKITKKLYKHNPSFNRIFTYDSVEFLQKDEVENFFLKQMESENIKIESDALKLMVEFTAGSPTMMQYIGEETYYLAKDLITKNIALKGIKNACKQIEKRYLQISLSEFNIYSDDLKILRILGKNFIDNAYGSYSFKLDDISSQLTKFDEEIFDDFIEKTIKADIIEVKSNDEYAFTNDLYPIYFAIAEIEENLY